MKEDPVALNELKRIDSPIRGIQQKTVLKLIVFGDGGVGKTTLIHRYLTGEYLAMRMTVGSGFATRDIVLDGHKLTLSIWDFAGERRFRFVMPRYCVGAHGGLLAFDMTRPTTFFHLDEWLKLVRANAGNIPLLLVGTKCDIFPARVDHEQVLYYAATRSLAGYLETSSKDDIQVTEAFDTITQLIWSSLNEARLNLTPSLDTKT